jgi:hypothetical protein
MMATIEDRKAFSHLSESAILKDAIRLAGHTNVSPSQIKRRLLSIVAILAGSVLGEGVTVLLITIGVPQSDSSRMLFSFMSIGWLALFMASILGLVVVLWSAYVYQYVQTIDAKSKEIEVLEEFPEQFFTAVKKMEADNSFRTEILHQLQIHSQQRSLEAFRHEPGVFAIFLDTFSKCFAKEQQDLWCFGTDTGKSRLEEEDLYRGQKLRSR